MENSTFESNSLKDEANESTHSEENVKESQLNDTKDSSEKMSGEVPRNEGEKGERQEASRSGFIEKIISLSARNPFIAVLFILAVAAWGAVSMKDAPLDAIPDLSDPQVILLTKWPGQSPDLVEDQVTYPLSSALMNAPGVVHVRGQSFFGLSFVNVIFEEHTDLYWARSRVLEYLNTVQKDLPDNVRPTLGPDATGVGWVYMYVLKDTTGKNDLADLRALQDWNLKFALQTVPGVAEIATVGGFDKQYQIQLDPSKMRHYNLTIEQVTKAVKESNMDSGGGTLEISGHEYMIRGKGYVKSVEDLKRIPLKTSGLHSPLLLQDVAYVSLGASNRRGIAEWNGEGEAVAGIVVMRQGENALNVIDGVKKRLDEIRSGLPEGVTIETAYDRSELINASIDTLKTTLLEEMIVVSLVIFIFLMNVRSALVPVITLPIALLLAFIPMQIQGLTTNIMSLGGLAVAIGAMVDASIIIVENIHKSLEEEQEKPNFNRKKVIIHAMQEVGPSIFFSLLLITVSFLPVFTLQGTEGRLFKPLAYTKTYSMAFASLLAVTLTPALAVIFIRGKIKHEKEHILSRMLQRVYMPVVRVVVDHRWLVLLGVVLAMIFTIPAAMRLKTEFMPPLNEGSVLYMPSAPPGMSMKEAGEVVQAMDKQLKEIPEVVSVLGKMGRSDTATDPAPLGMAETTIVLKPKEEWRKGLTWDKLIGEFDAKLQYPGMPNIWWMPIQTRTEMLATGIRTPLAIEIYGDDLETIEKTGIEIERLLSNLPGTRNVFAERSTGGFYLDVEINRDAAARYGVRVEQIQKAVQTAIKGEIVGQTIEGRRRFSINVRYARDFRETPESLKEVLVDIPGGASLPLSQFATLRFRNGPPMIRSEAGKLTGFVFIDLSDDSIGNYVKNAQKVLDERLNVPAGIRLEWTGQFKYLKRAEERLAWVLPITLGLVLLLLFLNTRSLLETGIVLLAVPFSLIGAIWLLFLLDFHLSIAVWVGLIALAGLDAETGVVMLLYLTISERKARALGHLNSYKDLREVIVDGAAGRIRPKLMTVMTTMIGLTPLLWSTGVGADVMKRIAAPLVGGIVTSFFLELTVYPAIYAIWKMKSLKFSERER